MQIQELMKKEIFTILPDATLREAISALLEHDISGLIVVNDTNEVIGILSEKDIYRALYPTYQELFSNPEIYFSFENQEKEIESRANVLVKDVMTTDVIKVNSHEYVMKVGALMLAKNIHRLPVVDEKGKLVGIISRGSIYRNLFRKKFHIIKKK